MPCGSFLPLELERPAKHLPGEGAREAAVAGEDEQRDTPDIAPLQERKVAKRSRGARRADHELLHSIGVRPHLFDPLLGAAQARARDELERLRDLARVSDRRDPPADVLERCQLDECAFFLDVEAVLELLDLGVQLLGEVVRQLAALANLLVDRLLAA